MILRNFSIGTRLAVGFGAILAVLLSVSVGGTYLASKSRKDLATVSSNSIIKERLASEMQELVLRRSSVMRNVGLLTEYSAMQEQQKAANKLTRRFGDAREIMARFELTPAERDIVDGLEKADQSIQDPFNRAMVLQSSFRNEEAVGLLMNEVDPAVNKMMDALEQLTQIQKQANEDATSAALLMGDRLAKTTYVVEGIVLAIAVLLAWTLTRSITKPLREAVSVARRVAAGDLTSAIVPRGRDEAAELLRALCDMNDGLGRIVQQIRSGSESIAVGATQVAAGNQQLSSRTEEHASSLEETASTLEEFTTTVRQNAEHAKQASALAGTASSTAEKGGEAVGKVVKTMQDVSTSSKRISDIIGVIDGISFQTNILALNAAVEAARAGEQGRGFAVVASEVRSLAQRSAASAKEIRGLIEDSVSRVENGARLVEQAGKTMDELVASVRRVAEIMTEIAAASHEQSSGIEQINRAITQMDNVVQMNASLVEEATAAATSMASQATGLSRAVAQFRLEEGELPAVAEPPASDAATESASPAPIAAHPAASHARREPMLAAADDDDWKEF
ncbi:MAG TPA: methyl-accepting chemotaxis protein [Usitatibacter sp.]|jgi:methyl-accepting chemotaxis protein|nr:methyl-accepting chemotaxis protein [Usitatibacter sp.]